jgi:hypothetical protein
MALIDMYRQNVARKRNELTKLRGDLAKERKKVSDASGKINRASDAIRRTKSPSTIHSRQREIQRYEKDRATAESSVASIEAKIATKDKELLNEEKRLDAEEDKIFKKRTREGEQRQRETERDMTNIRSTLHQHDHYHAEARATLENLLRLPEKINVVFFASNPVDAIQLRLDEEARAIAETIRKSKHRDAVKLESCWAVRPEDVMQALNEYAPAIVHFSGHGSDQDEIVFQGDDGKAFLVSMEAIVQTMMASSEGIRLVFFNTCHSHNQAKAVVEHVEAAIGMNTSIGDEAARVFASQFYSSVGFGFSVKKAFEQAKALLMLKGIPEQNTPELFTRDGIDADELIIVKPLTVE